MSEMQVIFLVQKEGVLRVWDTLQHCLAEESCRVTFYYYAEDKKEILKRDALERLEDLHFEIIADVHAIVFRGNLKDHQVVLSVSEKVQREALLWFEELEIRNVKFL